MILIINILEHNKDDYDYGGIITGLYIVLTIYYVVNLIVAKEMI